ncbi:hypothetical protein [Ghiorsea bivora]|uniref:hypothetical protein n=1 Tax=Ghiorsea bivora TaxID=1485545 RepID=UPI0012FD526D|nr:hypothetical protein [Ghiorsea bivora]
MIGWRSLRDESTEGEALIYALAAGAAIWLGSYLWKRYNKPNRKLPPLENKKDDDLK